MDYELDEPTDESTHQIPSNGLLFPTFYHFPYTADPPTFTTPMRPSLTITWSPSTIPYTHHTISLVPHWRPPIWPMDHIVIFSFLSLFPFTWHILLRPDWSQVVTLCDWDLTIHFTTHEHCARFTYHLYLQPFSVACRITFKRFLGASHFQSWDTQMQLVASSIPFGAKLKRVVFRVFGITKK